MQYTLYKDNAVINSTLLGMSNPYKALLNTESYEPVHELVKHLTAKVAENSRLISEMATVLDSKLEIPEEGEEEEEESNLGNNDGGDPLRGILDEKYRLDDLENGEAEFAKVENPRLRQLLIDNYKLGMLIKAKQEQNQQLFGVYQRYEEVIMQVIIPSVTAQTSKYNVEKLQQMKELYVEEKLPMDGKVWGKYLEYMDNLAEMRKVVHLLMRIMENCVDSKHMTRVREQLMVLESLSTMANSTGSWRGK